MEVSRESSSATVFVMLLDDATTWYVLGLADEQSLVKEGNTWINAHTLVTVPDNMSSKARGMICIHMAVLPSWAATRTEGNYSYAAGYAYEAVFTFAHAVTALLNLGTAVADLQEKVQDQECTGRRSGSVPCMRDVLMNVAFNGTVNPSVNFSSGGNVVGDKVSATHNLLLFMLFPLPFTIRQNSTV